MLTGGGRGAAWAVDEFRTAADNSPIREFLGALDGKALARATALIRLLAERGNQLRLPASKALDDGLFELRDVPTGVRIYYVFHGERRIVLLDGMVKKRDKIPGPVMRRLRGFQQQLAASQRKGR